MPRKRAQAEDRVFAGKVPTTCIMRKVQVHSDRETLFFHRRLGRHPRHRPAVCPVSQCGCHGLSLTWCSRSRLRGLTTGLAGASGLGLRTSSGCRLPTLPGEEQVEGHRVLCPLGTPQPRGCRHPFQCWASLLARILLETVPASAPGPASPPTMAGHPQPSPRCSQGDRDRVRWSAFSRRSGANQRARLHPELLGSSQRPTRLTCPGSTRVQLKDR